MATQAAAARSEAAALQRSGSVPAHPKPPPRRGLLSAPSYLPSMHDPDPPHDSMATGPEGLLGLGLGLAQGRAGTPGDGGLRGSVSMASLGNRPSTVPANAETADKFFSRRPPFPPTRNMSPQPARGLGGLPIPRPGALM